MTSGPDGLFAAHSAETAWEWARGRRNHFKTPLPGVLAGIGTGLVGLGVRHIAGEGNWVMASVEAGLVAAIVGFVFPQLQTLYWWSRRNGVLLDEANDALKELRFAAQLAAADKVDPGAKLRRELGDLMLSYVQLERDFIARGGARNCGISRPGFTMLP